MGKSVSHSPVSDSFATPWTVALQAPLSMGFSRQEYWSGWPFPFPGDLSGSRIKPGSPSWQENSIPSEPPGNQRLFHWLVKCFYIVICHGSLYLFSDLTFSYLSDLYKYLFHHF